MLNISKQAEDAAVTLALEGRLDTTTAPQLEAALRDVLEGGTQALVLDFAGLEYISSAGLRVLLAAQKRIGSPDGMKLVHVSEVIMEIFDVTGFVDILNIE